MSENKSQTPAQNTPENSEKKKVSLFALIVVLVVAVIVMVALFVRSNNLSSQLDEVNGQLAASNTELQQTIADKETAQAELTTAQNDLREAAGAGRIHRKGGGTGSSAGCAERRKRSEQGAGGNADR